MKKITKKKTIKKKSVKKVVVKKKSVKKIVKKIAKKIQPKLTIKPKKEKIIGKVTHYFSNIKVAVIKAKDAIKVGDEIHIKGGEIDFKQIVSSIQINHQAVKSAKKGQEFGMKTKKKVREGYVIYK